MEDDDYVELNGVRISKPFVEKPFDGDNHNVHIYYPSSMVGAGLTMPSRCMFNLSSWAGEEASGGMAVVVGTGFW